MDSKKDTKLVYLLDYDLIGLQNYKFLKMSQTYKKCRNFSNYNQLSVVILKKNCIYTSTKKYFPIFLNISSCMKILSYSSLSYLSQ